MRGFTDVTWMILALISGLGILQILRALAITVRNQTMIHDLRVGVSELQVQQFHAQMLRHGMTPRDGGVEILDDDGSVTADDPSSANGPVAPEGRDESPEAEEPTRRAA